MRELRLPPVRGRRGVCIMLMSIIAAIASIFSWLGGKPKPADGNFHAQPVKPAEPLTVPPGHALVVLAVEGLHCQGCVSGVRSELGRVTGVGQTIVDLATGRAQVVIDPQRVGPPQLLAAVEEAGFKGKVVQA